VPEIYCRFFIDTEIFQRLRHIEQPSMRVLYPSAHHDRFAHSLGVFHLGTLAFDNLRKNASESLPNMSDEEWGTYRHTFLIACLLHDCGHAPFSHTFEEYYKGDALNARLAKLVDQKANEDNIAGGTHEKVSAILVLEHFKENIAKVDASIDPILVARMILGWEHEVKDTEKKIFENCLICTLNSNAIDVDKLDYIARDTWASGVNNATIDIHRLLSALTIGKQEDGRKVLSFHKSALSVIQSVVTGRNYLFRWIYYHHKVCYDQWLLQKAVKSLAPEDTDDARDEFMEKVTLVQNIYQTD
jgi:HD superfamily phosphohydrolase